MKQTNGNSRKLVLASSSTYRKALLQRLGLPFESLSPDIDESPDSGESPEQLVHRLSVTKARTVARQFPDALIIGGDQVAVLEGAMLGKPGSAEKARDQLRRSSGKSVSFLSGLCLYDAATQDYQYETVPFSVSFKHLSDEQIANYVKRDNPVDCAGSFKWESLGIALFEKMEGEDITSLQGLPLIRLIRMLAQADVSVL